MTSVSFSTRRGASPRGIAPETGFASSGLLARIIEGLLLWQERAAQRRALAGLDDHLLKDMGITRAEADREARKPFWRA
ncbi:MAG: DUF1127 domain-containing protein [Kiloniellales bacterium]|nr:DUF1127 domain-containing protein [Kiloniellales bacterium]